MTDALRAFQSSGAARRNIKSAYGLSQLRYSAQFFFAGIWLGRETNNQSNCVY
jgi:hypothetical protein